MKTKAVLFDLWGTLFETNLHETFDKIFKLIGREHSNYLRGVWFGFWHVKDMPAREFFSYAFKPIGKKEFVGKASEIWRKQVDNTRIYPGVPGVLKSLKDKGLKLAIITNTEPDAARVLKKHGLERFFDYIGLSCIEGVRKPSARFYKKALKELKVEASEALMVGDKIETDVLGAERLGIKAVLLDKNDSQDYPYKIRYLRELEKFLE